MSRRTHYEVLGVSEDASASEIRSAFRKLTIRHHPDRFGPDKRSEAEVKFQEITEAFNVLSRPDARESYDKELDTGAAKAKHDPREMARLMAAKGAELYRNGLYDQAREMLESACYHDDDNGRAHYFLSRVLAESPRTAKEALRHAETAAQLEPNNPAILAETGRQFLEAGMKERARRYISAALRYDPTSTMAMELQEQLEAESASQSEGGGLFSRLRRKG